MDEQRKPGKRSVWAATIMALVLSLPILYALGIGPGYCLVVHRRITMKQYQTIYAPVIYLEDRSKTLRDAIDSYCMFCWRMQGGGNI